MAGEPTWVRAASHACGIATVGAGDQRITVVVLPKAWATAEPPCLRVTDNDLPVVTLFENQKVAFELTGSAKEALPLLLHKCSEAEEQRLAEEQRADQTEREEWEKDRRGLLSSWDPSKIPPTSSIEEGDPKKNLEAILDLLLLEEAVHRGQERYVTRQHHPFLAPIVHRLFVEEIRDKLRCMRRGYVERSERTGTIRGRVETSSLGPVLAAKVPRVRCTFDAFTEHTPMFRIIASALDLVARGTWLDHHRGLSADHQAGASRLGSVRSRGHQLRRQLASIPSYPLGEARERVARLRLPPMLRRRWGVALSFARDVLLRHGPDLLSDDHKDAPVVWRLSMSGLWERILARALESTPQVDAVGKQDKQNPPWKILGTFPRRRDLVFELGHRRYVLDAKYSLHSKPSAGYLNQVFVYGLLSGCDQVGLIYTRRRPEGDEPELVRKVEKGRWPLSDEYLHIPTREKGKRGEEEAETDKGTLDLNLIEAAFPARGDLFSSTEGTSVFEDYLENLGEQLVDLLDDLHTPNDGVGRPVDR